jgi:hypothetical protein
MSKLSRIDKMRRIEKMRESMRTGTARISGKESLILPAGFQLGANAAAFAMVVTREAERLQTETRTAETATNSVDERNDAEGTKLGDDTSENASVFDAEQSREQLQREEEIVFALAFEIEDPCGFETVALARELVRLAKVIPPSHRALMAEAFKLAINDVERLKRGR